MFVPIAREILSTWQNAFAIRHPKKMARTIQCDIVSSEKEIFSGEVSMFIASGVAGELGICSMHAPLITLLKPGPLRVIVPGGEEITFFAAGGILEVMPYVITALVDNAIRAEDIDEAAALRAREDAERQLANRTADMDLAVAQAKLMESLAQLRAVEHLRKKIRH